MDDLFHLEFALWTGCVCCILQNTLDKSKNKIISYNIIYIYIYIILRFSMGFRSGEFAGLSSTWSFNQLLVLLAVWAGAKSCWKMKSAFLKSWSAERSMKCYQNLLVNECSDVDFQKTQWTNTSRWHCTTNHHRLWKLNTGLQATWAMSFSTLPPDSRTLVSKWLWRTGQQPRSSSL